MDTGVAKEFRFFPDKIRHGFTFSKLFIAFALECQKFVFTVVPKEWKTIAILCVNDHPSPVIGRLQRVNKVIYNSSLLPLPILMSEVCLSSFVHVSYINHFLNKSLVHFSLMLSCPFSVY